MNGAEIDARVCGLEHCVHVDFGGGTDTVAVEASLDGLATLLDMVGTLGDASLEITTGRFLAAGHTRNTTVGPVDVLLKELKDRKRSA